MLTCELFLPPHRVKYYKWCQDICGKTYIHSKCKYAIRADYVQYFGSFAPHRRSRTLDAGHQALYDGPKAPYYKLTGELKNNHKYLPV